jgi:SNF2 family DNA or RNA helicase
MELTLTFAPCYANASMPTSQGSDSSNPNPTDIQRLLTTDSGSALDYFTKLAGHRCVSAIQRQLPLVLPSLREISYYTHQIETVGRVVKDMKGRAILADEVGLGKTIEAGLALREYIAQGLVKRFLILTPASLAQQWREELKVKFRLNCRINSESGGWDKYPFLIASIDTAKSGRNRKEITGQAWDLVIVDEAHKLKNHKSLNWKFVSSITTKFLLLLTATPIQNTLEELYNLVFLIRPGYLKTRKFFKKHFTSQGDAKVPANPQQFRDLLGKVLIRHRREETAVKFTQRKVHLLPVEFSPAEAALYRTLNGFIDSCYFSVSHVEKGLNRLTLMLMERMVTSSPRALAKTIEKILENPFVPYLYAVSLRKVLAETEKVREVSKATQVLDLVTRMVETEGKVIIFTQFRESQEYLAEQLGQRGVTCVKFYGSLNGRQKDEAIVQFATSAQVLVSTDSGAEGRNLQFCKVVINYDLPWNPMKVEQRIGRVHRLGQTRDVEIYNVYYKDSIEEYVVELLTKKIRLFKLIVGELDVILGLTKFKGNLESQIMDVYLTAKNKGELRRKLSEIGEDFQQALKEYEKIKVAQNEIF